MYAPVTLLVITDDTVLNHCSLRYFQNKSIMNIKRLEKYYYRVYLIYSHLVDCTECMILSLIRPYLLYLFLFGIDIVILLCAGCDFK